MTRPPDGARMTLFFNRRSSFCDVYVDGDPLPFHLDALIVHRDRRSTVVDCDGDLYTLDHTGPAISVNKGTASP